MARDTVPMGDIFETCYDILREKLRPLHYAHLTELALKRLGLTKNDVHWQRQIEDVREKMLEIGRYETFYIGTPYCLAGLRWWFDSIQSRLFRPTDGIIIPGNAQAGADGAFEALMRDPYMIVKTRAANERIKRTRANGIVMEKHVANWFKKQWPEFYEPPDNENIWDQWCDHDFKLRIENRLLKIDVFGPKLDGTFGNPGSGKKRVDLHLACKIVNHNILWEAIYPGAIYNGYLFNELAMWPERLIVYLNCQKDGLDYQAIKTNFETLLMAA